MPVTTNPVEPLWRPRRRVSKAEVPAALLPWLLDTASLTQRLISVCRGAFRVELIAQGWRAPMRNEALALALRPECYAMVREVHLRCAERPWVYARTVIPATTLSGANRRLAHLKTRSLGAVLFADPATERGEFELAQLTPRDALYPRAVHALNPAPEMLWGRRARFLLRGQPLLVTEIFLPGVPVHPAANCWHR